MSKPTHQSAKYSNEDYYATAREYFTSDDDAGGFNNFPDRDTEQPSFDKDDSASNTELQRIFNTEDKKQNCLPFTQQEKTSIELMLTLRETKASLGHYDEIMKWHLWPLFFAVPEDATCYKESLYLKIKGC